MDKNKYSSDMKKQINDLLLKMQTGENCIGETANELLNLFSVSKWVAVDVEMPKENENVILYLESNEILEGYYNRGKWVDQYENQCHEATHWQPLPEPPCC